MADKTLEQMLESLMNDDQASAENLFHEYVVSKSREIYETLIETELSADEADEEDESVDEATDDKDKKDEEVDEAGDKDKEVDEDDKDEKVEEGFADEMGGDPTDDLNTELDAKSDEFGDGELDAIDGEEELDSEFAEKEPVELFQDLETIVDELQAKFDAIGGDDAGEEFGADEFGADEFSGDDETGEEELEDGFDQELATVREYVEKIGAPNMGDNGADTKSVVAGKNDMGGTSANITKGGESKGEGTKGGLADVTTKDQNGGNINVPGGKAGKTAFKKKEAGHGAEKKGAAEDAENKQSLFRNKR